MRNRLVVVCGIEFVLAATLVLALGEAPAATAGDTASVARRDDQASLPAAPAMPREQPPAAGNVEPADTTARTIAEAKVLPGDPLGVLLTGTVRFPDGTAVENLHLFASQDKDQRIASTGAGGAFALLRLVPGEWQVTIRADGAADLTTAVPIGDDALQQHDFVVHGSFPVRVLIVTPDGQDATRALRKNLQTNISNFVVAGKQTRFLDRLAPTESGNVSVGDARWDYELNPENGFAGTLWFAAPLPGHAALLLRHLVLDQQPLQPDQGELRFVVDVEALKARLGSATVRVVDERSGAPRAGVTIALGTSNEMSPGRQTDADGRAVVDNLPPGLLHFRIGSKDCESHHQDDVRRRLPPVAQLDRGEYLVAVVGMPPVVEEVELVRLDEPRLPRCSATGAVLARSSTMRSSTESTPGKYWTLRQLGLADDSFAQQRPHYKPSHRHLLIGEARESPPRVAQAPQADGRVVAPQRGADLR